METYLVASAIDLNSDRAVRYAAGYFLDTALTWYRLHQKKVDAGTATAWTNWTEFKEEIIKRFQPIEPEQIARDRLFSLKQYRSVRAYADAFNQCMLEIPEYIEKDMIARFIRGLKSDIRVHVQSQKPATVDVAIDLAVQFESVLWDARRSSTDSFYR